MIWGSDSVSGFENRHLLPDDGVTPLIAGKMLTNKNSDLKFKVI
jgi:hypothetical protein